MNVSGCFCSQVYTALNSYVYKMADNYLHNTYVVFMLFLSL